MWYPHNKIKSVFNTDHGEINMATWQCNLCSHIYDEGKESIKWDDLPADWVCPICGSPKSEFTVIKTKEPATPAIIPDKVTRNKYQCELCAHIYDEANESIPWNELPDDWTCPVCGSGKISFILMETASQAVAATLPSKNVDSEYLAEWQRTSDDIETHMSDIHRLATTGHSIIEPMRTRISPISWDEILIKGAQLVKLPLNKSQPVSVQTTIGPGTAVPLIIESPVFVTHMSFGALSKEAKLALVKGSAIVKTAMCSGEGGIIPESLDAAYKYIFEYVPNKYSVTDEYLSKVDAVEIKIGQSAKPGMGGHLPGHKVTKEIATYHTRGQ
jgi:rubredoxin